MNLSNQIKSKHQSLSIDLGVKVVAKTNRLVTPIMINGEKVTELGIYKTDIKNVYIWVVDRNFQLKKDK